MSPTKKYLGELRLILDRLSEINAACTSHQSTIDVLGQLKIDLDRLIFDPLDNLCPVEIDWVQWLFDMHTCNKYGARNAKFSKKVFEREEDDAKFD